MADNGGHEPERQVSEGSAPPVERGEDLLNAVAETTTEKLRKEIGIDEGDSEGISRIDDMVRVLLEQVAKEKITMPGSLAAYLDKAITSLDEIIEKQLHPILHHPEFQKVESTWRGLDYLVHKAGKSEKLRIRVLDASRKDLAEDLAKAPEITQSGFHKLVYTDGLDQPGATPYGVLVADFHFSKTNPDLAFLDDLASVAERAHAPLIAGADPGLLALGEFTELPNEGSLAKRFRRPEFARWRSLREKLSSRYLGLVMARVMARLPYDPVQAPVDALPAFRERIDGHRDYVWMNTAWVFAQRLTAAFAKYGWCMRITGKQGDGGVVDGLPLHVSEEEDGTMREKSPCEIDLSDTREKELAGLGLISLQHYQNEDFAVFSSAQSVNKPLVYRSDDETKRAKLQADLRNTMAVCRFAHYIKVIQREKMGDFASVESVETSLSNWINEYVVNKEAPPEVKAKKPLSYAEVKVKEDPRNPGVFHAKMKLTPHGFLNELTVTIALVRETKPQEG